MSTADRRAAPEVGTVVVEERSPSTLPSSWRRASSSRSPSSSCSATRMPTTVLRKVRSAFASAARRSGAGSFGPRRYPDAMQPAPFEKIRLDWRHAYGGAGLRGQSPGDGTRYGTKSGGSSCRTSKRSACRGVPTTRSLAPVGFGPLDITHPDRQKLVGTYDEEWLKTDFPGHGARCRLALLPGRAARPVARDGASGRRAVRPGGAASDRARPARAVARHSAAPVRRAAPGAQPQPSSGCRLRTVVFLADADAVIQIWQGFTHLQDEDASELTHVLAGLERLESPRPESHYASVFARRLDEEDGDAGDAAGRGPAAGGHHLRGADSGDVDLNKPPAADSLEGRLERKTLRQIEDGPRTWRRPTGSTPTSTLPRCPGRGSRYRRPHLLGDYLRELDATRRAAEARRRGRQARGDREDGGRVRGPGRVVRLRPKGDGHRANRAAGAADSGQAGRPAEAQRGAVGRRHASGRARGDVERRGVARAMARRRPRRCRRCTGSRRTFRTPLRAATAARRTQQKRWVAERLAAGEPLAGFDLTGADLREFDLRGANLDGALMEAVCLDGVDLTGREREGRRARSRLAREGAGRRLRLLQGQPRQGAIRRRQRVPARTSRARFSGRPTSRAPRSAGARLVDVEAMHMKLAGADLSEAVVDDLLLYQTDLTGVRLVNASIEWHAVPPEPAGRERTSRARAAVGAVFLSVQAEGLRFDGADLTGAVFVEQPKLPGASMRGADAHEGVRSRRRSHRRGLLGRQPRRLRTWRVEAPRRESPGRAGTGGGPAVRRPDRRSGRGSGFAGLAARQRHRVRRQVRRDEPLHVRPVANRGPTRIDVRACELRRARVYPRWEPPKDERTE